MSTKLIIKNLSQTHAMHASSHATKQSKVVPYASVHPTACSDVCHSQAAVRYLKRRASKTRSSNYLPPVSHYRIPP